MLQVMSILHFCLEHGAKVWTIKDNYRLGDDIQSKVLAFAFGLSAEIERNLIFQRTKDDAIKKATKGYQDDLAKLFGKKVNNKKLAALIAGGAIIGAGIGLAIRPKAKQA